MKMRRAGAMLIVLLIVVAIRVLTSGRTLDVDADSTMVLGFVLVVSYFAGRIAASIKLPSITGYLLVGVLFGPYALAGVRPELVILDPKAVDALQLLDGAALGLIALTAGGELKLSTVRERKRSIGWIILGHVVIVFAGVGGVVFLARDAFAGAADGSMRLALAGAMLLGVTAVAKSPATTIAIIQEYQAKGRLTDVVLAVTVAKDVVVVTMFTVVLAASIAIVTPEAGSIPKLLGLLAWEVLGSLVIGVLAGVALIQYLKYISHEVPFVVLAIAFLSGGLMEAAHVSGLLVCMVAGFIVENYSEHGEELIEAVERHSLPLYIIFFTIAGAAIDIPALRLTGVLALGLVIARTVFTFVATWVGARIAGEPANVRRYAWTGFIGQAGVTLGFAGIIGNRLPELGETLETIIIAAVALNQVIGPIVFRLGLKWSGEIADSDEPAGMRTLPPT